MTCSEHLGHCLPHFGPRRHEGWLGPACYDLCQVPLCSSTDKGAASAYSPRGPMMKRSHPKETLRKSFCLADAHSGSLTSPTGTSYSGMKGFTSKMQVPSTRSTPDRLSLDPFTLSRRHRVSPIGLGLCGVRVAKSPVDWPPIRGGNTLAFGVDPGVFLSKRKRSHTCEKLSRPSTQ